MKDAQISWYVEKEEMVDLIDEEYFAGTVSPSDINVTFQFQVWNNKWGSEMVYDIDNPSLTLTFDYVEDNQLLNYCSVRIDNGAFVTGEIINNKMTVPLNRMLSGEANKGSFTDTSNYARIAIKFGPITYGMKNDLKSLIIDLQYDK